MAVANASLGPAFLRHASHVYAQVVSIFGNTGDGKSYAMNNTFFCGEDIFETSDRQESCTAGAWAAYDPTSRAIIVDTEGMQVRRTRKNAEG